MKADQFICIIFILAVKSKSSKLVLSDYTDEICENCSKTCPFESFNLESWVRRKMHFYFDNGKICLTKEGNVDKELSETIEPIVGDQKIENLKEESKEVVVLFVPKSDVSNKPVYLKILIKCQKDSYFLRKVFFEELKNHVLLNWKKKSFAKPLPYVPILSLHLVRIKEDVGLAMAFEAMHSTLSSFAAYLLKYEHYLFFRLDLLTSQGLARFYTLFVGAVEILALLQRHNIVYFDVKTTNFVISCEGEVPSKKEDDEALSNCKVKQLKVWLIDFEAVEFANPVVAPCMSRVYTPGYLDIARDSTDGLDHRSRAWSLGICIVSVFNKRILFTSKELATLENQYKNSSKAFLREQQKKMVLALFGLEKRGYFVTEKRLDSLVELMLKVVVEDRITPLDLSEHPLFLEMKQFIERHDV